MKDSFLTQALIYLVASLVSVPLAKRFGLGAVLGYLLAGIAIGPSALHLVGHEGHDVMHFAEFGVVMMLFLVGLELRPQMLWSMRKSILGLGGLQVLGTFGAVTGIAVLFHLDIRVALALGMIAAMSSTAIVLSSLEERKLTSTEGGRAAFAVLLFQDISVIPILAIFPLLRAKGMVEDGLEGPAAGRPGWQQAILVLVAVAVVVLVARYALRFVFRFLAETHLREVFTVAALALVIGIAQLMESVGLSAALGTFLAGVVLAESPYRHQLEADIEPFKGIL
ncbi:MAG: potassium transporter, partial [Proteobacteria bacterium]